MFRARPGHVLVMGDWDALEMRLGAYLSGDESFIADLAAYDAKTGPKIHIINMCAVFELKDEKGAPMNPSTKGLDKKYPGMYRAAKVFAYAVAYGAGPKTVFEQCRKEMPELDYATFEECYNRYKKFRQGLFTFQSEVVMKATMDGFIDTVLLRRRVYFHERGFGEDSPEASAMQNAPYQGGGADLVSSANKRVWKEVVIPFRKKLRAGEVIEQLAQVHDELVFEVPERLAGVDAEGKLVDGGFAAEFKRVAELLPAGARFKKWGKLPVDVKVASRWKPVLIRCDAEVRKGKGKLAVVKKCTNDVELEVESRLPHATFWSGKCKECGSTKVVEVPFEAAAS